jgi:hypothetical protein
MIPGIEEPGVTIELLAGSKFNLDQVDLPHQVGLGEPPEFTPEEVRQLVFALRDIVEAEHAAPGDGDQGGAGQAPPAV